MEHNPENLLILSQAISALPFALASKDIHGGHFTNGTYAPPQALIVPTVLTGFQYTIDHETDKGAALIIAVNSDKSMAVIYDKKMQELMRKFVTALREISEASSENLQVLKDKAEAIQKEAVKTAVERNKLENQHVRAKKVAEPLAMQNPHRKVVVVFYDEETPNALYGSLKESGFKMQSLFKWGYGTDPNAGVIEAAEEFSKVYAFPLPNDIAPVCADITRKTGQEGVVSVVDLREGMTATPYISKKNECIFPLVGEILYSYGRTKAPLADVKPFELKP